MDLEEVARTWHPDPTDEEQVLEPAVGTAAAGLWDQPAPGPELPPLWHWFHFLEWPAQRRVGTDGHLTDGAFLPPLEDRRRMFAGGVWRREGALRYGEPVRRRRSLVDARAKSGRSGDLLFVTVRSEYLQDGAVRVVEDQDIVYRSGPGAADLRGTPLATDPPDTDPSAPALPLLADEPLLFRMSALTANQHRIHYDRPYTVDVEHYAGLVVHGPLLVLHMAEVLRRDPGAPPPREIGFRLRAPAFAGEPLVAVARVQDDGSQALRIASAREAQHATATVRW